MQYTIDTSAILNKHPMQTGLTPTCDECTFQSLSFG